MSDSEARDDPATSASEAENDFVMSDAEDTVAHGSDDDDDWVDEDDGDLIVPLCCVANVPLSVLNALLSVPDEKMRAANEKRARRRMAGEKTMGMVLGQPETLQEMDVSDDEEEPMRQLAVVRSLNVHEDVVTETVPPVDEFVSPFLGMGVTDVHYALRRKKDAGAVGMATGLYVVADERSAVDETFVVAEVADLVEGVVGDVVVRSVRAGKQKVELTVGNLLVANIDMSDYIEWAESNGGVVPDYYDSDAESEEGEDDDVGERADDDHGEEGKASQGESENNGRESDMG